MFLTVSHTNERRETVTTLRIGVAGYSGQKFNKDRAQQLLEQGLDKIVAEHPEATDYVLVSGHTDYGIPPMAYREAVKRGWKTKGIACGKVNEKDDDGQPKLKLFPVDESVAVGTNWGDESKTFRDDCHLLLCVGGGKQTIAEAADFELHGKKVYRYELEALPREAAAS